MIKDIVLGLLIFSFIPTSPQLPTKQLPEPHKLSEYSTPQFTYTKTRVDIFSDLEQSQTFSQLAKAVEATIPKPEPKAVVEPVVPPSTALSGDVESKVRAAGGEALVNIVRVESNFNPYAVNASSGACGLFQRLPCSVTLGDVDGQIADGLAYVNARYGSPAGAWAFWQLNHWY